MSRKSETFIDMLILLAKLGAFIVLLRLALFAMGYEGYIPVIDDIFSVVRRALYACLSWAEGIMPGVF